MTDFVIQVIQAEPDEFARIFFCIYGQQFIQCAVAVLRCVQQVAQLQPVPAVQLIPAAEEAAGLIAASGLFQNSAVAPQVVGRERFDDRHHIDIAVLVSLAAQITALQAHINQPCAVFLFKRGDQRPQIGFCIDHSLKISQREVFRAVFGDKTLALAQVVAEQDVEHRIGGLLVLHPHTDETARSRSHRRQ